uniref:Ig-like domain-containing protein n=1 Tax=Sphaeramia orbicularis TaxID=375764 RepID=A0A672YC56_9TELE
LTLRPKIQLAHRVVLTLDPNWSEIFYGEAFTLRCEIQDGGNTGWTYEWTLDTINLTTTTNEYRITRATPAHRGSYRCRGRTDSSVTTVWSNVIKLTVAGKMKVVLTLDPNWSDTFYREAFTLRCEIQEGGNTGWTYEWTKNTINIPTTTSEYRISNATTAHRGSYRCRGRTDSSDTTQWSNVIELTVAGKMKPKTQLSRSTASINQESVTLTCSVSSSSGWKYYWYKDKSLYKPQNPQLYSDHPLITVSPGGTYQCRGGRGDPVYYSDYSNSVGKNKSLILNINDNETHFYYTDDSNTVSISTVGESDNTIWTCFVCS